MCNSLPNDVVSARAANRFKSKLDEFWQYQDVKYDLRADITGTGKRSNM